MHTGFEGNIEYYIRNGMTVYFPSKLDAMKAFNRVDYYKVFRLLLERNIPTVPVIIRLLLSMYTCHQIRILCNGVLSSTFIVKNRVMQGGIISHIILCGWYH